MKTVGRVSSIALTVAAFATGYGLVWGLQLTSSASASAPLAQSLRSAPATASTRHVRVILTSYLDLPSLAEARPTNDAYSVGVASKGDLLVSPSASVPYSVHELLQSESPPNTTVLVRVRLNQAHQGV
jgi:hypothetical protein